MKEAEGSVDKRDHQGVPGKRAPGVAEWPKAGQPKTWGALEWHGGPLCH